MSTKFQKNIINNILCKITQDNKNYPHLALFKCMKLLGFDHYAIRRAMVAASGLKMQELVDDETTLSLLYAVHNGQRVRGEKAEKAMEKLAGFFGMETSVYWEDVIKLAA